jgi:hypothetical protein
MHSAASRENGIECVNYSLLSRQTISHLQRVSDIFQLMVCNLDGTGVLEQRVQVTLLGLQIRVSTNVLLRNEDVGHGSLARHLAECALDGGAVICTHNKLARVLSKLVFRSHILHHPSHVHFRYNMRREPRKLGFQLYVPT